jgi:HlyD family secretion protein
MMPRLAALVRRPRSAAAAVLTVTIVAVGAFAATRRTAAPDLPTALVTKGPFVDMLEIRGEIRPLKSIILSSPMQSGELQILKLAKSGTMVKAGDLVVQFDPSTLQRTIQEKQSELKQAEAEIEQAQAQTRIATEQNATAVMKAGYDIERAKLDVGKGDTVSRLDNEQAKLAVVDARQRERELQEKVKSD